MKYSNNLILYFEDAPYRDDTVCTGLSRVNNHIQRAIGAASKTLIVRLMPLSNTREIIESGNKQVVDSGGWSILVNKIMTKIRIRNATWVALKINKGNLSKLQPNMNDILFAPIGTDLGAVIRANKVAKYLKIKLVIFLVDDLIDNLKHVPQMNVLIDDVKNILKDANHLFCATEGLVNEYAKINPKASYLPMPFAPRVEPTSLNSERSNEIIFLGNPSHFYQDGLEGLAKTVAAISNQPVIRATYGREYMDKLSEQCGGVNIKTEPFISEQDLANCLSKCKFSYVSYSFSERFYHMTKTSFPSKLFEYLAYSKNIIAWAPEYSTVALFFRKHNLPGIVSVDSHEEFQRTVIQMAKNDYDYGYQYRRSLNDFSYEVFVNMLEEGLNAHA